MTSADLSVTGTIDQLQKVLSQSDYQLSKVSTRLKEKYEYLYASSASHTNPHGLILRLRKIQAQLDSLRTESILVHQQRLDMVKFCQTDLQGVCNFARQMHAAIPEAINEPCSQSVLDTAVGVGSKEVNNTSNANGEGPSTLTDQLSNAEIALNEIMDKITDNQTNELFVKTLLSSYKLSEKEVQALGKSSMQTMMNDQTNQLVQKQSDTENGGEGGNVDGEKDISTTNRMSTKQKPPATKPRPKLGAKAGAEAKGQRKPQRDLSTNKKAPATKGGGAAGSSQSSSATFEPISKTNFNRLPRNLKIKAGKLPDVNQFYEEVFDLLQQHANGLPGKKLMNMLGLDSMQKLDVLRGLSVLRCSKDDTWTLVNMK